MAQKVEPKFQVPKQQAQDLADKVAFDSPKQDSDKISYFLICTITKGSHFPMPGRELNEASEHYQSQCLIPPFDDVKSVHFNPRYLPTPRRRCKVPMVLFWGDTTHRTVNGIWQGFNNIQSVTQMSVCIIPCHPG